MPYADKDQYKKYQKEYRQAHLDEHNANNRKWRLNHQELNNSRARKRYVERHDEPGFLEMKNGYNRTHRARIRELVFDRFGRQCVRCGSTTNLELDHVHPIVRVNGARDTKSEWIDALVFPKKYFQILCKSCNLKKEWYEDIR